MSERQTFRLVHRQARAGAELAVRNAPDGFIVEVKPQTRSTEQNALLWPLLTEVSRQVEWYGQMLTPEDWKDVFSAALRKQRVVPGLEGGFVVCGQSTSKMGKKEFSDLLELIYAFGAEHGVKFQGVAA